MTEISSLKERVRELREGTAEEEQEDRGRPVSLTLRDKPAPPIFDEAGSWTGEAASWFIEEGAAQGLSLEPMPGRVLRETEKALLFRQEGDSREVWIPKSVIEEVKRRE